MTTGNRARSQAYVDAATRRFREELTEVVSGHVRAGVAPREALGDPAEFATKAVRALAPVPSPWSDLAGPFTLSEGVQARLGISRQAVAAKAARRRLLRVVTSDGVHLYPLWQFDRNTPVEGFPEILALFPEGVVDGWTLAGWWRTPDPDLGEPPFDALVRGEIDRVQAAARTASAAFAA